MEPTEEATGTTAVARPSTHKSTKHGFPVTALLSNEALATLILYELGITLHELMIAKVKTKPIWVVEVLEGPAAGTRHRRPKQLAQQATRRVEKACWRFRSLTDITAFSPDRLYMATNGVSYLSYYANGQYFVEASHTHLMSLSKPMLIELYEIISTRRLKLAKRRAKAKRRLVKRRSSQQLAVAAFR